jgi:hypothetical protein
MLRPFLLLIVRHNRKAPEGRKGERKTWCDFYGKKLVSRLCQSLIQRAYNSPVCRANCKRPSPCCTFSSDINELYTYQWQNDGVLKDEKQVGLLIMGRLPRFQHSYSLRRSYQPNSEIFNKTGSSKTTGFSTTAAKLFSMIVQRLYLNR